MSDYESIHGTRVKYLTSDPTLDSTTEGQVWYNSTSGTNKSLVQIKAFSSGGNLSTGRRAAGAMGTQSAGAIAGGQAAPAYVNNTEEYSGASWASGGSINTTRAFVNNGTVGTQTAGLIFGGEPNPPQTDLANTEEYNGTSWSEQNDLNTARRDLGGCGIQTAALAFGGTSSPTAVTELYDGSSWTTSPGTLNTGRASSVGAGTQTAALAIGGPSTVVESWDGSSWTNGPSLNFQLDGSAGASGTSTDTLIFGGRKPPGTTLVDSSEQYDGSTWVTTPDMSTARRELMGIGTAQLGVAIGGFTPPTFSTATEEYNSNINAITQASWSSSNALNTGRSHGNGAGSQTAGLYFGGSTGGASHVNNSEEYNGSSWTEGNNLTTARRYMSGSGTQTSAITAGGIAPPADTAAVEEYDGTSWSNGTSLPAARRLPIGLGISTAAVVFGGSQPYTSSKNTTFNYDGSSWTSGGSYPISVVNGGACGTQTAGLGFGGSAPPYTGVTAEYDGSSWTASNSLIYARDFLRGGGIQTSAYAVSGANPAFAPGVTVATEQYDGTSWANVANQATSRPNGHAAATNTADNTTGLVFSGPSNSTATEEFTGGTSVTTASTLTTS